MCWIQYAHRSFLLVNLFRFKEQTVYTYACTYGGVCARAHISTRRSSSTVSSKSWRWFSMFEKLTIIIYIYILSYHVLCILLVYFKGTKYIYIYVSWFMINLARRWKNPITELLNKNKNKKCNVWNY